MSEINTRRVEYSIITPLQATPGSIVMGNVKDLCLFPSSTVRIHEGVSVYRRRVLFPPWP